VNLSAAKYWLLLACILATAYGSFLAWRRSHAEPVRTPSAKARLEKSSNEPPIESFVLTDQAGEPFDSASLRGQVWVGSFFFTNCPAICWKLNQALAGLQETNPTSGTRFVSITCDPDNDKPEALAKYAAHFKADPARWKFLTGDFKLIRRIGNDLFHVAVEKETHSDRAFVVDSKGQVRGRFQLTDPAQFEMLKQLLAVVEAEAPPAPVDVDDAQSTLSIVPAEH
jgi:cytochrome oxidase Cu insertion factor (SCO1/SenC/PrrC family)